MRQIKLLSLFLILIIGGASLHSCSNSSSRNNSQKVEYNPDILDTDRIIQCYELGGIEEDILRGTNRAMLCGNILVSQNGIIKALQMEYSGGEFIWHKITYFSIHDNTIPYKCVITGKIFNKCADIRNKDVGRNYDGTFKIFWN